MGLARSTAFLHAVLRLASPSPGRFIVFQGARMAALQLQDFGADILVRLGLDHRRAVIGSNVRFAHPMPRSVLRKPRPSAQWRSGSQHRTMSAGRPQIPAAEHRP